MRPRCAGAVVALLLGAACAGEPTEPLAIARAFWEASREGNDERVLALSAAGSTTRPIQGRQAQFTQLALGDVRLRGDDAIVETSMTVVTARGDSLRITFPTHLVQENGVWRVALDMTMGAALRAMHGAEPPGPVRGDSIVARDTAR